MGDQKTNNMREYVFNNSEEIRKNKKRRVMIQKERNRNWKSLVFFIYGCPGIGKTNFVEKIYREYYSKPQMKKNGNNWWSGYDKHEVVSIDEFQRKVDYEELINVLDKTELEVEESQGKFVPFLAKYVFLMSSKSLFDLSQTDNLFEDLYYEYYRMIDYVIEFGIERKIKICKGDEQKFFNME